MASAMRNHTVGIIADTHGLLRPEAVAALQDSDLLIHAGDIGKASILDFLRDLAPLTAIRGNVDRGAWADLLPDTEVVEVGDRYLYVLHDLHALRLSPDAGGFDAVISAHSHRPHVEEKNGVLYFNPGSAGPRRFSLPVCVGRIVVDEAGLHPEIIKLEV